LLAAVGIAAGLAGALGASRMLGSLLYGLAPGDASTIAVASAAIALTALCAAYLPARRASRIDPAAVLRAE
jgi:ABC-type antimicrobial peptide transport system permease subunit